MYDKKMHGEVPIVDDRSWLKNVGLEDEQKLANNLICLFAVGQNYRYLPVYQIQKEPEQGNIRGDVKDHTRT